MTQQHTGGSDQYYVFDPMGNTRLLLSSSNTVVKSYLYKAFGEELANTGSALSVFGYGGQVGYYRDVSTRLLVRARHLDTGKGRWISRDPIGFDGGDWNLYQYAWNDPTGYTDSSGNAPASHQSQRLPPDPSVGNLVPCPPAVGIAKSSLCTALRQMGVTNIANTDCCTHTGPDSEQAQCLIDWCNGQGNVYCVNDTTGDCGRTKACALDYGEQGKQEPKKSVYLCFPRVLQPQCAWTKQPGATCKSEFVDRILHEVMHLCGSAQGGGSGISNDPAENRAQCLCGKMKL